MPVCASCGQENPDGFKFCGACGSPLVEAPPEVAPEEERKVVTALFTDIVGSTASAEKLDPEDVRARLAPYYTRLRKELESFGGTVEKFIGDAVVALFGAPVAHEDDPERAVRAAIAIRDAVAELNAGDAWLDLHIRTAVHTGEALVVPAARASEGEGMAAGDVMNTAARLQGAAPVDGIAVGEATYRATRELFEYEPGEPLAAKGKSELIPCWVVVGERAPRKQRARTPIVGRALELGLLLGAWSEASASTEPRLATVVGPPGIGKSRLLLELAARAEETSECAVHWGRCLPYGEGITYWPVIEIVKDAAGVQNDDDPQATARKLGALLESLPTDERDELRTIAAALSNLLGAETTPEGTYSALEIGQPELHWGIRRLFELLSHVRPLLLVLEDLHWAEPTLLELLEDVVGGTGSLLVVGSARPELREEDGPLATVGPKRLRIELEPLDESESGALLEQLLGAGALGAGRLELLLQNAAGNPLFLEETVGMLADAELLGDETELESIPVPESLQALIGSRLDSLGAPEKRVAQQASVVGANFWVGAVAHLAGGNGDLTAPLAALEAREFVHSVPESTIAGDLEYAFRHMLIRDVAYERLPKGRRAELHVRFGDWLEGLGKPPDELVEILAYHLEQACRLARSVASSPVPPPLEDAAAALARAGRKAERRGGIREANRYYSRALDLVEDRSSEAALDVRLRWAFTHNVLGEVREAAEALAAVADDALQRDAAGVRGNALAMLGQIDLRQGKVAEARDHLTEAHEIACKSGDRQLEVRAIYRLSALSGDFEGELEHAVERVREGIALAEQVGDRALQVEGHLRLGFFLENLGELALAQEELEQCLRLSEEIGSLRDDAQATYLLGLVRYYRGDPEEAERLGLQAREWLERTGETFMGIQNLVALATYALARDDAKLAERWLQEALPLALEGGGFLVVQIYRYLVEALVRQARLDDARQLLDYARRDAPAEDPYAETQVLLAEASYACGLGDADEAARAYSEALRLLEEQSLVIELAETRLDLARALRRFADAAGARLELGRARETFAAMGAAAHLAEIDGILGALEAEGAGVTGPLAPS